jgi:hypothetical protein
LRPAPLLVGLHAGAAPPIFDYQLLNIPTGGRLANQQ